MDRRLFGPKVDLLFPKQISLDCLFLAVVFFWQPMEWPLATKRQQESINIRYLLRLFDCLANPNLGAPFATDQKWPICHLRISYQSLAGGLRSLQKSEFLKMIISFFHYFCSQNWNQWHKMSEKNTHIYFFYFWFKNKQVREEKIGKKRKNSNNLKVAGNYSKI